jgi:hypothetical protein
MSITKIISLYSAEFERVNGEAPTVIQNGSEIHCNGIVTNAAQLLDSYRRLQSMSTFPRPKPEPPTVVTIDQFKEHMDTELDKLHDFIVKNVESTGNTAEDCQRIYLLQQLAHLRYAVNGTEQSDLIKN